MEYKAESIQSRIDSLQVEFSQFETWEERYKHIIARGKELDELSSEHKIEKNLVKGCQSQVWLVAELKPDGSIGLKADSDAMIVKGLVSVLLFVYSGSAPEDILKTQPQFLEDLGFKNNLSPSRANGLFSMVKQIQYFAMVFQAMQQK